jgi:hypothetical protein
MLLVPNFKNESLIPNFKNESSPFLALLLHLLNVLAFVSTASTAQDKVVLGKY